MDKNSQVFSLVLLIVVVAFFTGKSCGKKELVAQVEALKDRVGAAEHRLTAIEYPPDGRKPFWPKAAVKKYGKKNREKKAHDR